MFERFTESARRVVVLAQQESHDLGHRSIGTAHLLLALVREGESGPSEALRSVGVDIDRARAAAAGLHDVGKPQYGHIPFTPTAKRALEMSLRAALREGHNFIGTAHLLAGLLANPDDELQRLLAALGVDADALVSAALEVIGEYGEFGAGEVIFRGHRRGRRRFRLAAGEEFPTNPVLRRGYTAFEPREDEQVSVLLRRLAEVEDARLDEARARAAAEARLEMLGAELDEARAELDEARAEIERLRRGESPTS